MAVFEKLSVLEDQRKGSNLCYFNGYLEDYISSLEDGEERSFLEKVLNLDNTCKICVGYGFNVNREVISNQIIRYKDGLKLSDKAIRIPYILYFKKEAEEKAVILSDKQYMFAKGYYYCLTEQFALLESERNEAVAMCLDNKELVLEKIEKYIQPKTRAGVVQREVENYYFKNVAEMTEAAKNLAEETLNKAKEELPELTDRNDYIQNCIMTWYLLKKVVYVSYMMNKDILKKECEGNTKKQRFNAKTNADRIPFMAFSEMWRMKKESQDSFFDQILYIKCIKTYIIEYIEKEDIKC